MTRTAVPGGPTLGAALAMALLVATPAEARAQNAGPERAAAMADPRSPSSPMAPGFYVPPTPESEHGLPLVTSIFTVAGIAGLVVFTFEGVTVENEFSEAKRTCAPHCATADVDALRHKALVADLGLGVGVVSLGVALFTWLTHHDAPSPPAVDVRPTTGGAVGSLGLRF